MELKARFIGMQKYGIEPRVDLRWGYEYIDHKVTKYGMWNKPGEMIEGLPKSKQTAAWCQSKEHLSCAFIEVKDEQKSIKKVAIAEGWNFVNFEWSAITPMAMSSKRLGVDQLTMTGEIYALVLLTREKRVEVRRDGKITVRARTPDEMRQNLSGFGR